jgi:hypothetical protein
MKVEPSGVIMTGVCEVQTPVCQAREPSPITAVWSVPARNQINVCRACLEQCVRDGAWEIPGARIQRRFDVAVQNGDGRVQLVVEVKTAPGGPLPAQVDWAAKIHRNLLLHAGIPSAPNFLLVGYPDSFFVWIASRPGQFARSPDYVFDTPAVLARYRGAEEDEHPYGQERVVAMWLEELLRGEPAPRRRDSIDGSGGLNALVANLIRGGTVVRQAPIAA